VPAQNVLQRRWQRQLDDYPGDSLIVGERLEFLAEPVRSNINGQAAQRIQNTNASAGALDCTYIAVRGRFPTDLHNRQARRCAQRGELSDLARNLRQHRLRQYPAVHEDSGATLDVVDSH